jgi:hypothetical protein
VTLGWADENDPPAVATVDLAALLDEMSRAWDRVRRASDRAGVPVFGARVLHHTAQSLNRWADLLEKLARRQVDVDADLEELVLR